MMVLECFQSTPDGARRASCGLLAEPFRGWKLCVQRTDNCPRHFAVERGFGSRWRCRCYSVEEGLVPLLQHYAD